MKNNPKPPSLRLRKKHGEGRKLDVTAKDGARLDRAQSFRGAVMAALIALIVFCLLWVCGLKRTLILKKFRTAGQLREYLEILSWE